MPKTQRAKYFEAIRDGTDQMFFDGDVKVALAVIVDDAAEEPKMVMIRGATEKEITKWLDARVGKTVAVGEKTYTIPARKRRR